MNSSNAGSASGSSIDAKASPLDVVSEATFATRGRRKYLNFCLMFCVTVDSNIHG